MNLGLHDIPLRLIGLIPLILSLTVHEFAHAWTAYVLGDDTAARQGRMTLNPIVHIDPIGTLLLPVFVGFGWAKPVPVVPTNFRRNVPMTTGMMLTSVAGPLSNLMLSSACAIIIGLCYRFSPDFLGSNPAIDWLLDRTLYLNVGLAIFNMLPIPPLDGSRMVDFFLPYRWRARWEWLQQYSPMALPVILIYGGSLISGPVNAVESQLRALILHIAT